MDTDTLESSLDQYRTQLSQINEALKITPKGDEYDSLHSLKSDIQQLIDLTLESLETVRGKQQKTFEVTSEGSQKSHKQNGCSSNDLHSQREVENKDGNPLDDEYALFMSEMVKSGAYDDKEEITEDGSQEEVDIKQNETNVDSNIDEELASLEGMKCSTMYSHKWGGAPSLHNAMVCSVVREDEDNTNFYDIKVRVMFTNPTHAEMVPCPFYLDGDCKFEDNLCRFSHGEVVHLSSLSEAVEPNFALLKTGCRVLAKLNPTDEAGSSKAQEKFRLWHRAVVKSVDVQGTRCEVQLEHESGMKGKGKSYHEVDFSQLFPLTDKSEDSDTDTESSSSDAPTHENAVAVAGPSRPQASSSLVEYSLQQDPGFVPLGDWEKHTKGIGSKLMQQMGYVQGTGLGPSGAGRLQPVPCRPTLPGRSLDHCMTLREYSKTDDPLKGTTVRRVHAVRYNNRLFPASVRHTHTPRLRTSQNMKQVEKKLQRLQKRQEEREKKAYDRAKERETHNVFNVLNDVFSSQSASKQNGADDGIENAFQIRKNKADKPSDVKSSTCKNLNIEHFNICEDIKRLDKDVLKLKLSLSRNSVGSAIHRSLMMQMASKSREVQDLKTRQRNVSNEQNVRKDKKKMTVF